MTQQLGFVVIAVALITAATVGLCLGHLSADDWMGVAGPSALGGAVGHYLSSSSTP